MLSPDRPFGATVIGRWNGLMNTFSRTVPSVIDHYLDRRRAAKMPLSVRDALVAVRTVMPDCAMTDRELADRFASAAIAKGRDVAFDMTVDGWR
jgi:hypothetical protein